MFKTKEQAALNAFQCWIDEQESFVNGYIKCKQAFLAGCEWQEKDMLESASSGFEEWFRDVYSEAMQWRDWQSCDNLHNNKHNMEKAWQACALSKMKEIQEKDEEIARLKEEIRNLTRADLIQTNREDVLPAIQEATHYNWLDDKNEKLEVQYQEAMKDIEYLTLKIKGHLTLDALEELNDKIRTKYGLVKQESKE